MTSPPSAALIGVAEEMLAAPDALGARVLETVATTLPELADEVRLRELLASTVLDNVVSALKVVTTKSDALSTSAPQVALEFARRLAQHGVPITVMLRAYRIGQAAFQQLVLERIAGEAETAEEVAAAAQALSATAFSYIDTISEEVIAAYQAERDAWLRQRNAARLAKVIEALSGKASDAGAVENSLGYRLARRHVGAVLWCTASVDEAMRLAALERAVPRVAAALHSAGAALSVAPDASTVWAWFPAPAVRVADVTTALAAEPDVLVAVGEPGEGLLGFRASHQQALQAQTVALAAGEAHARRVTSTAELGPLALLAADLTAAGAWVQSVLGALADDDEQHARMRETLWAYLSSGGSLAAAADELHLHKNTIQYRIRKAEEARGRPFTEGRLDVEVALLAARVLGSAVLRPVD